MSKPGLCAGGNADPCNKVPGYVAFVRTEKLKISGKLSEQRNFEWYREHIILTFVTKCRVTLYDINATEHVPGNFAAVCWNNGANVQLVAIMEENSNKLMKGIKYAHANIVQAVQSLNKIVIAALYSVLSKL